MPLIGAVDAHVAYLRKLLCDLCCSLAAAKIDYRIVGGMACFLHVDTIEPIAARLTPGVDVAISRADISHAIDALAPLDLVCELADGLARLKKNGTTVGHLLFVREKIRERYAFAVPDFSAAVLTPEGFLLASIADLIHMKLTSYRIVDRCHLIDLDSVGLITHVIERALPELLRRRLEQVRAEERQSTGAA